MAVALATVAAGEETEMTNEVEHVGGGWYQLSSGEKIRGKKEAEEAEALLAMDSPVEPDPEPEEADHEEVEEVADVPEPDDSDHETTPAWEEPVTITEPAPTNLTTPIGVCANCGAPSVYVDDRPGSNKVEYCYADTPAHLRGALRNRG